MNRRFSTEHIQWPPKKISLSEQGEIDNGLKPISPYRVALPQVLASTAKNLLLLDLGMTIAFATIVIPALQENKDTQGLRFTKEEASWFGSLVYMCQPLGSVLSGFVLEPLGRKKAMMLVNVPHIIGWFLFYISVSKALLFFVAVIMGLGVGFMEAPIITYVGEIAQPKLRGTLTSYANLFVTFGMMFIWGIGSLVDWRTAAAIAMVVPIMTVLAISQVPETPIWLMARGKKEEAEKALCWLRGWVGPEYVKKELEELEKYSASTKLQKDKITGVINPAFVGDDGKPAQDNREFEELSITEKVKDFVRPGMLKPLGFIIAFFFFSNFTGITSTRPYLVLIAEKFQMPMEPYMVTVVFGVLNFIASLTCMMTIAKFKKRPIALTSMAVASLSSLSLYLSTNPWVNLISYGALMFSTSYGAQGLVWTMVSEVFPFRGRGMASGLAAAASYFISFAATKSFQPLQDAFSLHGVFIFYSILSFCGLIFLYFLLPETEGRALQEIENDYEKKIPAVQNGNKASNIV